MKIDNYKVLSGTTTPDIESAVMHHVGQGYILYGPLQVILQPDQDIEEAGMRPRVLYIQAMIKMRPTGMVTGLP